MGWATGALGRVPVAASSASASVGHSRRSLAMAARCLSGWGPAFVHALSTAWTSELRATGLAVRVTVRVTVFVGPGFTTVLVVVAVDLTVAAAGVAAGVVLPPAPTTPAPRRKPATVPTGARNRARRYQGRGWVITCGCGGIGDMPCGSVGGSYTQSMVCARA